MVDWLVRARQEGYAIPAFNVCELQSVRAIVEVCEEERAPCLLQVAETHVAGMEPEYFVAVVRAAAELARVPVALHYDHGRSFEGIMRAIRAGFTSVMIDGSDLPYAENVALTREIVRV
ncbi:MAG: class II fructose-bisphosphate aldolase, partial [Chloroflexi bacterium]|nr:class II fructose-bisphosphate aldolase [Chloroflexota bacterium]